MTRVLTLTLGLVLASTVPVLAQPADLSQPPATGPEVQANPRGDGPATMRPPTPATADAPVAPAMPADPAYRAGPYQGALTAPPALNKSYPLCSRKLEDNCRNPSQAGHGRAPD